jgi:hypothetical protein
LDKSLSVCLRRSNKYTGDRAKMAATMNLGDGFREKMFFRSGGSRIFLVGSEKFTMSGTTATRNMPATAATPQKSDVAHRRAVYSP